MSEFTVRDATASDAQAICAYSAQNLGELETLLPMDLDELPDAESHARLLAKYNSGTGGGSSSSGNGSCNADGACRIAGGFDGHSTPFWYSRRPTQVTRSRATNPTRGKPRSTGVPVDPVASSRDTAQ